jgi:hypothetical protein
LTRVKPQAAPLPTIADEMERKPAVPEAVLAAPHPRKAHGAGAYADAR